MHKLTIIQKLFFPVAVLGSLTAFASDKYECSIPVNQEIGIGLEAEIEVLSPTSANVNLYKTSDEFPKISEVSIQNPGSVIQVGDVLQIRNYISSISDTGMTGVSQIDLDLALLTFKFDQTDVSIPCVKVPF